MNPLPIIYTGLLTERSAAAFPVFKAMLLPPGTSISMPLKKLLMPSVAEEKDPTMLLIIARTSAPMPVKMAPTTARYTPASQPQRFAAPRTMRGSLSVQSSGRAGSSSGSSGSASESSQSTETPRAAPSAASFAVSGRASPVSLS